MAAEPEECLQETRAGEQANGSPEAAAELFAGEQQEEEEGQEGSDDDMDEHLLRLEGALTAQAARMMMPGLDSQADPVEPLNRSEMLSQLQTSPQVNQSARLRCTLQCHAVLTCPRSVTHCTRKC